jgi:hypothetical protein
MHFRGEVRVRGHAKNAAAASTCTKYQLFPNPDGRGGSYMHIEFEPFTATKSCMIEKIDALRLVTSYLAMFAKYWHEQLFIDESEFEDIPGGWGVDVFTRNLEGSKLLRWKLLIARDGKIYRTVYSGNFVHRVLRDIELFATNPTSLVPIFEPDDLDDFEAI